MAMQHIIIDLLSLASELVIVTPAPMTPFGPKKGDLNQFPHCGTNHFNTSIHFVKSFSEIYFERQNGGEVASKG